MAQEEQDYYHLGENYMQNGFGDNKGQKPNAYRSATIKARSRINYPKLCSNGACIPVLTQWLSLMSAWP